MTATVAAPVPVEASSGPTPWHVAARCLWLALVLGWVALAAVVPVVGARSTSFDDLERAVAAGEVDEVRVAGGLGPGSQGFATVRVTWRDGLIGDTTQVLEARPRSRAEEAGTRDEVSAVLDRSVADRLEAIDPDVEIQQASFDERSTEMAGWHLPGWVWWPQAALAIATLLSVMGSPPPWRATRWAWFWLVGSGPVGLAAYLLLAGPLPFLPAPRPGRWRLTGGWALLLVIGSGWLLGLEQWN
ncbi:hypothetical protein [Nocardioides sp. W7]|uniref:hypothetical protein n=1 Tax=Nocardioides sp. W7 TaxID=2931390 RepID=UPI001FD056B7|nr:hypothetical protein [Nocardioides sp. W7]